MSSTILVGCNRLSTLELRDYWAEHKGIKNNNNNNKKSALSWFEKIHLDPVSLRPGLTLPQTCLRLTVGYRREVPLLGLIARDRTDDEYQMAGTIAGRVCV